MQDIPISTKAVIKAKTKSLKNLSIKPFFGTSPALEYQKKSLASIKINLNHLGNNQYMSIMTLKSGLQRFKIKNLVFTRNIESIYNDAKAIVIVDAVDVDNTSLEIYPITSETSEKILY
jgi:hypothetical protein